MSTTGLRVAFDMDGTVADMHSMLRREAERLFEASPQTGASVDKTAKARGATRESQAPPDVPPVVARDDLRLSRDQWRTLWDHVERIENFWTTLPEMEPGIVARIAAPARARRWGSGNGSITTRSGDG